MRLVLIAAALLLPVLAYAETAAERQARCDSQAEIVAQALTLRAEGKRENRAIRDITKARAALETPYTAAVSVLVGWVYALPADQTDEAVTSEFIASCTAYAP